MPSNPDHGLFRRRGTPARGPKVGTTRTDKRGTARWNGDTWVYGEREGIRPLTRRGEGDDLDAGEDTACPGRHDHNTPGGNFCLRPKGHSEKHRDAHQHEW